MKGNLLLVDEGRSGGAVLHLLENAGYDCAKVRGPLKLRSFLEKGSFDLVVWNEIGGQSDLAKDLVFELGRFPKIPVVHVYPEQSFSRDVASFPLGESLPAADAGLSLLPAIRRLLAETEEGGEREFLQHTELAFRHLFTRLRSSLAGSAAKTAPRASAQPFHAAGTALEPLEKELLFAPNQKRLGQGGLKGRLVRPLLRIISIFRVRRP